MPEMSHSRRRFLTATAAAAGATLIPAKIAAAAAPDRFVDLRARRRRQLVGSYDSSDAGTARILQAWRAEAQRHSSSLLRGAKRTALWPDLADRGDSRTFRGSYDRILTMAMAYALPGTALTGDAALRGDLISALDWLYDNRYNPSLPQSGDWWPWQIGAPLALNDICVLMRTELGVARVDRYMATIAKFAPSPPVGGGANLVWACMVNALRGANEGNAAPLDAMPGRLNGVFRYATTGDGFYRDGSFIQHTYFPNTGGYGVSLLTNLADLLEILNGTSWVPTTPEKDNLYNWLFDAYSPVLYRGAMMDMVRGRELSRHYNTDRIAGHNTLAAMLTIARFAPAAEAAKIRRRVKQHLRVDTLRPFATFDPLAGRRVPSQVAEVKALLADNTIQADPEPTGHWQFAGADRVVHRRPGFAIGIAMSSKRIATHESIHRENMRSWYTADGMVYLYDGDLGHYSDQFWSTVDFYRLPGTTVDTRQRATAPVEYQKEYRPPTAQVGGAVLDQRWGAVGMQLDAEGSSLGARKAWFCLDDEIICLGADIRANDGRRIETVVENRKVGTDRALTIDGDVQPATTGWSSTFTPRWAHLQNVGGYVFPTGGTLQATRVRRSGRWTDFNQQLSSTDNQLHTRDYATMYLDHGVNPTGAGYAYVMLPGATVAATQAYAKGKNLQIAANTPDVQAVWLRDQQVAALIFWRDGTVTTNAGTVSSGRAAVVMRRRPGSLDIAVSDPTRQNTSSVTIGVSVTMARKVSADPRITVLSLDPVRVRVDVNGLDGRSVTARFTA